MSRSTWGVVLAVLLVVAAAIRLPHVLGESVIGDEVFTRDVVAAPLGEGMRIVVADAVHPPLHSLVLEPWSLLFGDSVRALRGFSLLASLACVLLTAWLGRQVFGAGAAPLCAAALVALNDAQAFYGHTARAYAMYAALVLLVLLAAARCLRAGASGRRTAAFALASAVLVYTHYVGWLFLVALLAGAWLAAPARDARRLTWAVVGVGVAFLPWAVPIASVLRARGLDPNLGWMDRPTWRHPQWIYEQFAGLPSIGVVRIVGVALAFALVVACAIAVRRARRTDAAPEARVLATILATAILPPLLLCALAQDPVGLPIWGTRHLLPGQAPFALAIVGGILAVRRFGAASSIAAATAMVSFAAVGAVQGLGSVRVVPYAEAARYIASARAPHEPLHVGSPHTVGLPLAYHAGAARDLSLPPAPVAAPAALWLAYRPGQTVEARLADGFVAAGFAVTDQREFVRAEDDPNRLRVVRLTRERAQ